MRSLLVVMLLVLAVSICHAEETKTEYAVSVDTTKINLGGQVDQVAEALKKHMEGPMGMYYQAAVARNRVVGIAKVVFNVLLMGVAVLLGAAAYKFGREADKSLSANGDPTFLVGGGVITAIGSIVAAIYSMTGVYSSLGILLAPEYYAMNDILTKLGRIVN